MHFYNYDPSKSSAVQTVLRILDVVVGYWVMYNGNKFVSNNPDVIAMWEKMGFEVNIPKFPTFFINLNNGIQTHLEINAWIEIIRSIRNQNAEMIGYTPKIEAIKFVRNSSGLGLAEAKELVESI